MNEAQLQTSTTALQNLYTQRGLMFTRRFSTEGVSPYDVVRSIQGSAEVAETLVATWYSEDLQRPGSIAQLKEDSGVQGWAAELGNF